MDALLFILCVLAGIVVGISGIWFVCVTMAVGWGLALQALRDPGTPTFTGVIKAVAWASSMLALSVTIGSCHAWLIGLVASHDGMLVGAGQMVGYGVGGMIAGALALVLLSHLPRRYDRVAG